MTTFVTRNMTQTERLQQKMTKKCTHAEKDLITRILLNKERINISDLGEISPVALPQAGLYFITEAKLDSNYNPHFFVKVGLSKNISNRMKQYATHTALIHKQVYLYMDEDLIRIVEEMIHLQMRVHEHFKNVNGSEEIFEIPTREKFEEIKNAEFSYFTIVTD